MLGLGMLYTILTSGVTQFVHGELLTTLGSLDSCTADAINAHVSSNEHLPAFDRMANLMKHRVQVGAGDLGSANGK